MENFVVLECTDTLELMRWGSDAYGVWTPTESLRVVQGRGAKQRVVSKRVAAFPGYVYVPQFKWPALRRACPMRFNVRPLGYYPSGQLRMCTVGELKAMEFALKVEALSNHAPPTKGDCVKITVSHFAGQMGMVHKCKANGEVRVAVHNGPFINIPGRFLLKC